MKIPFKLLLFACALQIPLLASYAPLNQADKDEQNKRLVEIAAPRINQTAAPIVQQVPPPAPAAQVQPANNQPLTCSQRCQRSPAGQRAILMGALVFFAAVIAIPIYFVTRPKAPYWYPCADQTDDMTNKCFALKVSDCGSCPDDQYAHARCGYQGPLTAEQLIIKISQQLNGTCGMQANYCVSDVPCAKDIWVCDTDNLAGFKKATQEKCSSIKPNSIKPNQHLSTKFMKRSNKIQYSKTKHSQWH